MLGKCTVCLCLHLSLSLSPCVFFCSLNIQTPASWICIYIPTSQRPRSLVAAFVRVPCFPWVLTRHLFPVPSSLLVHHRALAQSLPLRFPLGVFPFRFNSPQSSNSFFPSFFSQLPFLLQVESSHVSFFFPLCFLFPSFGSSLSFFPFFSRLLSIHPPFHLHPLSPRFPLIITDFTSFATSSTSLPSPCYTALPQLNRWKTQLSSVLSHPCFLLAFYKTPGHRKAAIYHGRETTPRDTKAFEAVINLKHVGGMFQSVEERVRKHSAPCSPWQDCRWHTEPGSDPGLISGMWFLPKA